MSRNFAFVLFLITLFTASQAQAQTQDAQGSSDFQVSAPHFIYSKDGKETLKITPFFPDSGDSYVLIDHCDGQRSHCAPLVPGHERLSTDELLDQSSSQETKGSILQTASYTGAVLMAAFARHAILAYLSPLVGSSVAPWVLGAAGVLGFGSAAYKEGEYFYHHAQLDNVYKMDGVDGTDTRVFSTSSYGKELAQSIDQQTQDQAKAAAKTQAQAAN